MDSKPKFDTAQVYRAIADLLPTEGRDFNLKLATDADGNQSVILESLTPLGGAWLPFLKERLENPLGAQGVGVEQARRKDDEFTVRLDARLRDQNVAAENDIA